MSLTPIPANRRHRYTVEELALADAGRPDLARRSANKRREPGHGWAGSRLQPLSLTAEQRALAGFGITREALTNIARTDAAEAKRIVAEEAQHIDGRMRDAA